MGLLDWLLNVHLLSRLETYFVSIVLEKARLKYSLIWPGANQDMIIFCDNPSVQ